MNDLANLCTAPEVRDTILKDGACSAVLLLTGASCEHSAASLQRTSTADVAAASTPSSSAAAPPPPAWMLLYDVMRVHKGRVMFLQDHFDRITESFHTMTKQVMSDAMRAHVEAGIRAYAGDDTARGADTDTTADINVKFLMWVNPDTLKAGGFVIFFVKSFFPPAEWYQTGIRMALLFNACRTNPSAKVVQSSLRARATHLQTELDVFEALLVHGPEDHYLIPEGSRSNYFLITPDNELLCSAEEDILLGITLRAAREAAVTAGLGTVQHAKLTVRHLLACTAMVMLGTSPGVLPVREIVVYHDAASKAEFERACDSLGVPPTDRQRITSQPGSTVGTLSLPVPHPTATHLADAYLRRAADA